MSLQSILEIVLESLTPAERRGFAVAEEIYRMQHSPTEREALRSTMEIIIKECVKRNLRYGRAFFLKFKQLERGEWSPEGIPQDVGRQVSSDGTVMAPRPSPDWYARHAERKVSA